MRAAFLRRNICAAAVMALAGGYLVVAAGGPASGAAASDGPPQLLYTTPQIARTAGGTPLRIEGSGFAGTTKVTFGGKPALKFKLIDGNLLTATVPPAAAGLDNTSVAIEITDNQGTGGSCEQSDPPKAPGCTGFDGPLGVYYTDGTITVTPKTGLHSTDTVTVAVRGYKPNIDGVPVEINPLVGFLEGGPDFAASGFRGPPPYVVPHGYILTDSDGSASQAVRLDSYADFNSWGGSYDANSKCPPTQVTADFGLSQCIIAYSQFAVGTLEAHVSFVKNPKPAAPTLVLSPTAARKGGTVQLSGVHWNNNAYFGSDTTPNDPGETKLVVYLCNADSTGCAKVTANATVDLTRYKTSSTTTPINGVFSGATLSGSFVVPTTASCAPNCLVKVQQQGYNYDAFNGKGTSKYITATKPLSVS